MTLIKYAPPSGGGGSGLRNAVLSAQSKDFLTSSGLNVGILGGTICSIAKGFDSSGNPDDAIVNITTNNSTAWGLPANSTSYLWVDETGSFGSTTVPWSVEETFDYNPAAIVNSFSSAGSGVVLSANNRIATQTGANSRTALCAAGSGTKQYFEAQILSSGGGGAWYLGVVRQNNSLDTYPGATNPSFGYYADGGKDVNGSTTTFGASYSVGDVIGIAIDQTTGRVWGSKNGVWQASGNPSTGANPAATLTTGDLRFAVGSYLNAFSFFLPDSLVYPPPTGFNAFIESQHVYCPPQGKTKQRVSGSWVDRARLFVGEAVTGASSVTSLISYAIGGIAAFPVTFATANTSIVLNMRVRSRAANVTLSYPGGSAGTIVGKISGGVIARSPVAGIGRIEVNRGY